MQLDPEASTPGADAYVGVTTTADGGIHLTKKKPFDRPLSLSFRKTFAHGLGGGPLLGTGVRAANDQIKTVLSNLFESSFEIVLEEDFRPVVPPPRDPVILPAVSIAKDDGRTTVVAGERLDYVLVAANASDFAAPDVVVTDTLPEQLDLVSTSIPLSDASEGRSLVWELGDLAAGEVREIVVSATVRHDVAVGDAIVNTASITSEGVCEEDPATESGPCTDDDVDIVVPPLDPQPVDAVVVASAPGGLLARTGDPLLGAYKVGVLALVLLLTSGALAVAQARARRSHRG
ncbi:DUF11 domain-containing protein [Leifsonia shinshuensis]